MRLVTCKHHPTMKHPERQTGCALCPGDANLAYADWLYKFDTRTQSGQTVTINGKTEWMRFKRREGLTDDFDSRDTMDRHRKRHREYRAERMRQEMAQSVGAGLREANQRGYR